MIATLLVIIAVGVWVLVLLVMLSMGRAVAAVAKLRSGVEAWLAEQAIEKARTAVNVKVGGRTPPTKVGHG